MSYEIIEQGIGYVVVKQGTHQIVGRHKTFAEAKAQLRALRDMPVVLADIVARHGVLYIPRPDELRAFLDFSAQELAALGKDGKAFRNGNGEWSYPTPNASYVHKAMQAFGRSAPGDRSRLKAYLKRRAAAVGLSKEEIARIDEYSS